MTKNIIGLAAVALLALSTPLASAKDWIVQTNAMPPQLTNLVNTPGNAGIATSNNTSSTAGVFEVPQNVQWSLLFPNTSVSNGVNSGSESGTSNTTYTVAFGGDPGFKSANDVTLAVSQSGTNNRCAGTNFAAAIYGGYRYGKVTSATTGQTNNVQTPYFYVMSLQ